MTDLSRIKDICAKNTPEENIRLGVEAKNEIGQMSEDEYEAFKSSSLTYDEAAYLANEFAR